jgi:hypothetical protein
MTDHITRTGDPSYWEDKIIYSDKGGIPCGNLYQLTLDVKSLDPGNSSLSLYPNPASNTLTITSSDEIANITITNLVGQVVYCHEYNEEKVQVSVEGLAAGVYFVRVGGKDGSVLIKKFIKE